MEQEQAKASHSLNLNTAPRGFPGGSAVKNPPADTGTQKIRFLGGEDPLEKEMATHSSILA